MYNNTCATCGAKEGIPHPSYGGEIVVMLQQGHQDPYEDGNDIRNIIPQCNFCNRTYKNNFVFNEKGRVIAVANIEPVRKARRPVQKRIQNWLNKTLKIFVT